MMNRIHNRALLWLTPVVLSTAAASSVAAQDTRCEAADRVGYIGVDGIRCTNCMINAPGTGLSRFSTEPVITSVEPGSPAADQLKPGDVIVSVDGNLITTTQGAYRFSTVKPG